MPPSRLGEAESEPSFFRANSAMFNAPSTVTALARDPGMRRNVPTTHLLAPRPKGREGTLGRRRGACPQETAHIRHRYIYVCIFLLLLLGRCERTLAFRFYVKLCMGLRTPSLPCLRPCFFDRFPQGSREPASDGCCPVRASRSLAPPTSAATPNLSDIC